MTILKPKPKAKTSRLSEVGSIIGAIAPTIATALGGPLAGMAVAKLAQVVIPSKSDPADADISAAIHANTDPALFEKMHEADNEFALQMQKLNVDVESLADKDVEGARQLAATGVNRMPQYLGYGITIFFCVYSTVAVWLLFKYGAIVPADIRLAAVTLAGQVMVYTIREVSSVYSFTFGSSQGSSDKNDTISDALKLVANGKS